MPRTAAVVHMPVEVDVVRPHPEALLAGRQQVGWAPPTEPSEGDMPQESHVVRKWQVVAVPGPPYIYSLCKHAAADTKRDSQRGTKMLPAVGTGRRVEGSPTTRRAMPP